MFFSNALSREVKELKEVVERLEYRVQKLESFSQTISFATDRRLLGVYYTTVPEIKEVTLCKAIRLLVEHAGLEFQAVEGVPAKPEDVVLVPKKKPTKRGKSK